MATTALPIRFKLRVEVQALVNALRRPTSDRMKLLRLAANALRTLEVAGIREGQLRTRLAGVHDALAAARKLDLEECAAQLDHSATDYEWTTHDFAAFRPRAVTAVR